jgi:hypothetical protein
VGLLVGVGGDGREPGPAQERHGGGDAVRRHLDVGVDEDQHAARRVLGEPGARPGLAQPAAGERCAAAVEHLQPRVAVGRGAHHVGGAVGRAVVEHEHLEVGDPDRGEQRGDARRDARGLVARRHEHAHALRDRGRGR